jgi:hypothetical protein
VENEFKEQFIYPKNALLKKSLQGIICEVLARRRVVFRPEILSSAIINYNGWIDDSNFDTEKAPGANYKKAVNILKTFEGKFTKFIGLGGLEVFIFRVDGRRVKSFAELEELCSLDPDMSEVVATTAKLDLDQKWDDVYISTQPMSIDTRGDITKNNSAVLLKKEDCINEIVAKKPNSFKHKHKPRIGRELTPDELEEFKASVVGK